jgi:asparagine synthase (glutamine-hydrolysing)
MCGIIGMSTSESMGPDAASAGRRMIMSIAHRGPDDRGLAVVDAGRAIVGNTRLAILDLSHAGHQPMRDETNGNVIAFNGEIYNHLEIRRLLRDDRNQWNSSSDTETILRAYGAFGEACVHHLRGMFAFCIWDQRRGVIFCARDRVGIKPFYYYADAAGVFVLASEVRSLLSSGRVPRKMDQRGLAGFVRFGSVPEPWTLIAGVHSLPPGHQMVVRSGHIDSLEAFWKPPPTGSSGKARPENAGKETNARKENSDGKETSDGKKTSAGKEILSALRHHLERSVGEQLRSDVPVATFLSGGIDSSVITALAARASLQPIHTITLGFDDREFDETEYALAVGHQYKTIQHRVRLSAEEVVELIPEAVQRCDLPSADGLNTYLVSRAAVKAGIKVVLSGLGGDELFGGYRTFPLLKWACRLAPMVGWSAPVASLAFRRGSGSCQRALEMLGSKDLESRYASLRSLWSVAEMREMGLGLFDFRERSESRETLFTRISILELSGYMRNTLLRDSDAMSMAHSIELRVPFLDHELVQWCREAGAADYGRGSGKKRLLLRATADLFPPETFQRKKQGFNLPMDKWMRGPLAGFVAQGLAAVSESGILPDVDLVRLRQRFQARELPWARLWQFAVLGHWVQSHLSAP